MSEPSNICPVCGKPREACCPCDLDYLNSKCELELNYEKWKARGAAEVAEYYKRQRANLIPFRRTS